MSQSIFEIRQVFNVSRQEIGKADDGQFSIANAVKELGKDQLIDNINHMLSKEAGKGFKGGINLQYNPVDYLSENYEGMITPELREEGVLSILQFAVQTNCLDQTVLQAVHLGDNYLRFNQSCSPAFIRLIYAMSLEISIKMNEQTILSLEDIEALFENRFNQDMLINLERHILSLNNFRVNMATPLDYVLNFAYLEEELLTSQSANGESIKLQPDQLVNDTLYLLHYAMSQYGLSRKKYSSLAVASMCLVLQDAHDDLQQEQTASSGLNGNAQVFESASNSDCCSPMQELRDAFLASILQRFPQLDFDEIYEILSEFKVPFIQLAQNMMDGQNEYSTNNMEMVSEPWTFDRLFKKDNIDVCNYKRNGEADDVDMEQTAQQQQMSCSASPHNDMIPSLNLGKKDESSSNFQQIRRIETEGDLIISTAETSIQGTTHRDYYKSNEKLQCGGSGQKAPMLGLLDRDDEELKSANGGNLSHRFESNSNRMIISPEPAPHELGRPSLSESNGSHSRTFKQSVGNNENLFDDNLEINDDQEQQQQQKMHLQQAQHQTSGSRLNKPSTGSLMQEMNATEATDGPFQVIRQDVDEPFDEYDE